MEKVRKLIREILAEAIIINENGNINKVLAETTFYKIVQVNNSYRIINHSKLYRTTVPFLEISKGQADKFIFQLNSWKGTQMETEARVIAAANFNLTCDEMFHNKNTQNYLDDDDDDY